MAAASRPDPLFTKRIHAQTTHYTVASTPRLGDQPWMVVSVRWSVRTFTEHVFIGGRAVRWIQENDEEGEVAAYAVAGPAVIRNESDCRFFFNARMLGRRRLPRLARHVDGDGEISRWDKVVPAGLVARIVYDVTLADRSGAQRHLIDASVMVDVTSVYSEAEALLQSCDGAAVAPSAALPGDATEHCSICMEELADGGHGVTGLPGCSHAFHRGCILKWFNRAPTCPYCRHDMTQYISLGPKTRA